MNLMEKKKSIKESWTSITLLYIMCQVKHWGRFNE